MAWIFTAKDELVFMLVRLCHGWMLKELSFETGVSEAYIRRIFTTWIQLLYIKFSALKKRSCIALWNTYQNIHPLP